MSGIHGCVLVVGFEQMDSGPLIALPIYKPKISDLSVRLMNEKNGKRTIVKKTHDSKDLQPFENAGREYIKK